MLPIIAGIICGLVGLFVPEVLGLGSETIRSLLVDEKTFATLVLLLVSKVVLTVVCIRFGLFWRNFFSCFVYWSCFRVYFSIFFKLFIPDANISLFAVAGMAAVTGSVIGGPISIMIIIFELTSDYQVALGAGISICFANLVSTKIYGHSAFDQILLNRNIDIQIGRDSLQLQSIKVGSIIRKDYIRLSVEHSANDMIKILSTSKSSEGYIINPKGVLIGKVLLPDLFLLSNKSDKLEKKLYENYLSINDNESILESIEKIIDFIGETVPVVDSENNLLGVITESDLFNQLLSAENKRKKRSYQIS